MGGGSCCTHTNKGLRERIDVRPSGYRLEFDTLIKRQPRKSHNHCHSTNSNKPLPVVSVLLRLIGGSVCQFDDEEFYFRKAIAMSAQKPNRIRSQMIVIDGESLFNVVLRW